MSSVTSRRLTRTGGRACVRIAKNCDLPAHSQITKNRLRRNQPVGGPSSRENGWHCVSYTLCRDVYVDETYFDIQKWFRLVSDFCLTFVKSQTKVKQKSDFCLTFAKSQTNARQKSDFHVFVMSIVGPYLAYNDFAYNELITKNRLRRNRPQADQSLVRNVKNFSIFSQKRRR